MLLHVHCFDAYLIAMRLNLVVLATHHTGLSANQPKDLADRFSNLVEFPSANSPANSVQTPPKGVIVVQGSLPFIGPIRRLRGNKTSRLHPTPRPVFWESGSVIP
jgi:hypothetical protein